jgi:hypothetical protein
VRRDHAPLCELAAVEQRMIAVAPLEAVHTDLVSPSA